MTDISVASANAQPPMLQGYLRSDGRKGIRNVVAVAYLVECAHHVAREIVTQFREPLDAFDDPSAERETPVHLIGFPGCYPNGYAEKMLERLTTHPNVGAVLFVSLGCESMNKHYLVDVVRASGRPVHNAIVWQDRRTTELCERWRRLQHEPVNPFDFTI